MAYLKTLQPPLQAFSSTTKQHSSSSSSSIATMKSIKTLIHTLVVAHLCRAFRALRRAKSILIQALKDHNFPFHYLIIYPSSSSSTHRSKRLHVSNKHKKIFFGSFRLHYNWGSTSSSHVLPVPDSVLRGFDEYEGSCSWKKNSGAEVEGGGGGATLAGYLLWLEEKDKERKKKISDEDVANEIDRLAEMFIADCHEKFQLEKQESMRRFQEMMARSM